MPLKSLLSLLPIVGQKDYKILLRSKLFKGGFHLIRRADSLEKTLMLGKYRTGTAASDPYTAGIQRRGE